ncbi:MAG TPA: hypothetical protein VEU55_10325 [Gemmatimonadales bacterium]|nr:hypothetical protein [Gemmatimonadales bacterium]
MALKARYLFCELLGILAACTTAARGPLPPAPYPVKQVVRQEIVLVHPPQSVFGKVPPAPLQTRYLLFSRDASACEVTLAQYWSVRPGDWVVCDWRVAPTAAPTRPS